METFSAEVAAQRAGVGPEEILRLRTLGILPGDPDAGYTDADIRRVQVVQALERSEMPVEHVGRLIREGSMSLDFIDTAGDQVFTALSDTTFAELSARTEVPVEVLLTLRDATGGKQASPTDRVREDELQIVPLIELQLSLGFRPAAVERALRVYGHSLRRVAEAEAEWWRSEIQDRMLASGASADEVGRRAGEISPSLSRASDDAVLAIYHAQQMHVWSTNIVDGIATALEQAGLHTREERHPAMCFLDITGYTQLTHELGDAAAAQMVERLNRIVQRSSVRHGGRPVKWLGDGVMSYFPDPGRGVVAAVEMVAELATAELPPAHVGLHAGPVVFQEGDYYGQTVNVASRIGDYARPGEVLVSRAVRDAFVESTVSRATSLEFTEVGPVELKGLASLVELLAVRAADSVVDP
jgi:class 3 adenylate cyclase